MTVTPRALVEGKQLENTQTDQYTATNVRAIIDKATVTNTTAGAVTLSANVLAPGASATAANRVISSRSIAAGETYHCPELIGQVVEDGGKVSTLAGAAASLTFRMSGREIT